MTEYREVTLRERQQMMEEGIFDINGNIPAHPGYTGIHKRKDGTYWFYGQQITDAEVLYVIEHRDDPAPIQPPIQPRKGFPDWIKRKLGIKKE